MRHYVFEGGLSCCSSTEFWRPFLGKDLLLVLSLLVGAILALSFGHISFTLLVTRTVVFILFVLLLVSRDCGKSCPIPGSLFVIRKCLRVTEGETSFVVTGEVFYRLVPALIYLLMCLDEDESWQER